MRTLTNSYSDCELLNLRYNANGSGPYVIRQDGTPPGSAAQKDGRFLLRKDGTWVLNITVFSLPSAEQEEKFLYADVREAFAILENLGGKAVVDERWPEGKSEAELLAALQSTNNRIWSRIREAKGTKISF